jgi:hypothetical protein
MNNKVVRMTASMAVFVVIAAGCSKSNSSDTSSSATTGSSSHSMTTAAAAAGAPDATAAAGLRSALTGLLEDHVWLAGNALNTAISKGGNLKDPAVVGAVNALDANSVALSKAVGSVYPAAEAPFLTSWRQHIGFFVNYTLGKATKDAAMVTKAKADLDGYRTAFGQLINSVVPELPADAVAKELIPHVQTLFDAIDAMVAGSPDVQTKLQAAAAHMVMTADILAGGIAKNKKLAGDVDGTASTVRATLTGQLEDHVWLAGNALATAVAKGGNLKDPAVVGAVNALDANSVALSKTVGSVYPAAQAPFLTSWRQHIGFFVNYTLGKATKDAAMVTKAKADLDGYRTAFGQLINSVVPELPADAVAKELIPHVQTLFDTIDALVAGSPDVQTKLQAAAAHMPMTAAILAGGIVKNKGIKS